MRKSKLLACLMAVILCVVSVSAAFAAPNPREAIRAMKETACKILQDMGYHVVLGDNVKDIEATANGDLSSVTISTKNGNKFSLSFTKDGTVKEFTYMNGDFLGRAFPGGKGIFSRVTEEPKGE